MQSVVLREEKCMFTWQISGNAEKDVEFVEVFILKMSQLWYMVAKKTPYSGTYLQE